MAYNLKDNIIIINFAKFTRKEAEPCRANEGEILYSFHTQNMGPMECVSHVNMKRNNRGFLTSITLFLQRLTQPNSPIFRKIQSATHSHNNHWMTVDSFEIRIILTYLRYHLPFSLQSA